jgi:hypothetical protein
MIANVHRTDIVERRRPGAAILGRALIVVAGLTAGCHILDVSNPDVVLPASLTGAAALPTIRAGVIGDFGVAYSGSGAQGSGGTTEGQILLGGMLADELINTETFPDRILADARRSQVESATLQTVFRNLQKARRAAEVATQKFRQYADTTRDPGLSEMLSLGGFTYVFFAENYCSGVPFSAVQEDGSFAYGGPLTTRQILDTAISRFNQARAAASVLDTSTAAARATRTGRIALATVGKARALLDEGQFGAADAAATTVPTTFNYLIQHDLNTTRQNNGVYNGMRKFKRYGVPDSSEGRVGLPWRTVADPRTPVFRTSAGSPPKANVGFDGVTPQYDQSRYMDEKASVTLATGAEARLISAEVALQGGDTTGMMTLLNALRTAPPTYYLNAGAVIPPMAPLVQPPGPAANVNLLFAERGRWLWLTSHRLGDLRRLERQYGRPDNQVFPTGPYFKSGLQYGSDVNLPVPIDELNNPNFLQCIDRLP